LNSRNITSTSSFSSSGGFKYDGEITTSDGRDYYEVLDISPDATQTEIREAFYRYSGIQIPDRSSF
jgi:hypothetical protein